MDNFESIEKTKRSFEYGFYESKYYNRQTQDDSHLNKILSYLDCCGSILDLGTGSGYLAFPLAMRDPACHVTGLDIVEETLERNNVKAVEQSLSNLNFICYDGTVFPFDDRSFDAVVTRYALHHFPDIQKTFSEISRVLKPGGQLFLSDPKPDEKDTGRFIDSFMQMKDDGHISFYTQSEFEKLAGEVNIKQESSFFTDIRFPRKLTEGYHKLIDGTSRDILEAYCVEIVDDEIYITEKVQNICYRKIDK